MNRFLAVSIFALSVALIGPASAQQHDDKDDKHEQEKVYHDKAHNDDHSWNSGEDKAYRVYLEKQHRDYADFDKTTPARQQAYFKWRHQNPDSTLFRIQIK